MNRIDRELIDDIRDKTDIVDVISRYISLQRSGKNFKALCPFHHEKTPSFIISPERKIFHCFGCGKGGNVFHFLMAFEKISFIDAVKRLANEAGVFISDTDYTLSEKDKKRIRMLELNGKVCEMYQRALREAGDRIMKILREREIKTEDISKFKIGYAPLESRYITKLINDSERELAIECGIIKQVDNTFEDFFKNRIIFPILNESSKVVGFSGRIVNDNDSPKYINTSSNLVFDKSRNLYGIHIARKFSSHSNEMVIVEGYTDVITMQRYGFKNCVATMGTALTDSQLSILARLVNSLVLLFDGDSAGKTAAERGIDKALSKNFKVKIVIIPGESDPDDYLKKHGAEKMEELIKNAKDYLEFLFERECEKGDTASISGKIKIVKNIIPILKRVPMHIDRRLYSDEFSKRLNIESDIFLRNIEGDMKMEKTLETKELQDDVETRLLLILTYGDREVFEFTNKFMDENFFTRTEYSRLFKMLQEQFYNQGYIDTALLMNNTDDEKIVSLISYLEMQKEEHLNKLASAYYLMKKIIEKKIAFKINEIKKLIQDEKTEKRKDLLLKEFDKLITSKKELLKNMADEINPYTKEVKV
ncbi:MAG: DNA primase [Candidatus Hydrogenedentota bacterium]